MSEVKLAPVVAAHPRLVISATEWLADIPPPNYLVKPLLQVGQLTALVAHPNHGKSTFSGFIAVAIAAGLEVGGYKFRPGNVLLLAGDNEYNARLQIKATQLAYGLGPEVLERIRVYPTDGEIERCYANIRAQRDAEKWPPFAFVLVDTFSAYFGREDENSNVQTHEAISVMQRFTRAEWGMPCVMVNCHPAKEAKRDNLKPRGGGAIFGRVDSCLTLWNGGDGIVTVHYNKIRGVPWDEVTFQMHQQQVGFSDGSVTEVYVARLISEADAQLAALQALSDEEILLEAMRAKPEATQTDWAKACGWTTKDGRPYRQKVANMLTKMAVGKKVFKRGGVYVAGSR